MNATHAAQQLGVTFKRYDATEARQLSKTIEALYKESYVEAIARGRPCDTVEAFMERFKNHCARPDLDLVIAYHDGAPVGQTWGWPLPENTREWDGLKPEPDPEFIREDGRRTFALAEIMVIQSWKGRGVGHALHDTLLSARPEPRATLFVEPDNIVAHRAYERWGWIKVGQLQPTYEDAPIFDVMVIDLSGRQVT
jgi:GNAT superfamily N-acetyltransferase